MRAFALLLSGIVVFQAANAQSAIQSAIGAMAQSAADDIAQKQALERQRALMVQQHNQDMERIRAEGRMRMEEQDRASRRKSANTYDVPTEQAKVKAAHPDAVQIINSNAFDAWRAKQPPSIQKLGQSDSAGDLILLLDFYKSSRK